MNVAHNPTLLVTIGVIVLVSAGCDGYSPTQLYWDSKVKKMCEGDGGVRIIEKVTLSKEQFTRLVNNFGQLAPPLEAQAAADVPIVRRSTSTYIRRNDPEVRRDELTLVRKSDGKVLGALVSYSRVGGDLFALHPTFYSCPESSSDFFSLVVHQQ